MMLRCAVNMNNTFLKIRLEYKMKLLRNQEFAFHARVLYNRCETTTDFTVLKTAF